MKADQLSVEYFGAHPLAQFRAEHEAALPAWQADEPVAPIHHPIARIQPDPEVLEWLEGDVRDMEKQALHAQLLGDPESAGYFPLNFPCTPRLQEFLRGAVRQFAQIVRTHQSGDQNGGRSVNVSAVAGPYAAHIEDYTWHQDDDQPGGLTYISTFLGRTTIYSNDPVRRTELSRLGTIKDATFLPPGVTPLRTISYDPWVVSAHDSLLALHRAPGPENEGHPRIRLNTFVRKVF